MQSKTEFSDGTSLTLTIKEDIDPTKVAFNYFQAIKKADARLPIIERLEKKREKVESIEDYEKISGDIDKWNALPSSNEVTNDFIFLTCDGWDMKDSQTGEPKPFNEQAVKGIHFTRKLKIMQQLIKDLGFDERELADPKASSETSSSPLTQKAESASSQGG